MSDVVTDHEAAISALVLAWESDEAREEQSRRALHDALRAAMRDGVSAYRLAALTGLSERHVGRIRREG